MLWLDKRDLPQSVVINGEDYPIETDFRTWIQIDGIIQDPDIPIQVKPALVVQYSGIDSREPAEDIWRALLLFLNGGKEERESAGNGRKSPFLAFRYDWDVDLLYAAFRQQYGINILTASLHWYEFRALFAGLTDQTQLIRVIQYRTMDTSKMSGEQKKQAERVRDLYRIPDGESTRERTPQEIEADLLSQIKQ